MSYPYDESQPIAFEQDVVAAYAKAGQPVDLSNVVWVARMQFDAVEMGYPASRAKHLAELNAQLGLVPPFPPPPPRERVCGVQLSFQGMTVQLSTGPMPWFPPALCCLTLADRQVVYAAMRAAGDTHAIVAYQPGGLLYGEAGQPYAAYACPDYTADPQAFRAQLVEVITAGFIPCVFFPGAGPDVETAWLPGMVAALQSGVDLTPYILHSPGYDGVFYGWTPPQIAAYGAQFRALGGKYLALEHNFGQLPLGGGPADYAPGGPMDAYDVVLSEFSWWDPPALPGPQLWQIASRLLGPAYVWPPDEPYAEDGHPPPFYLTPSPRGPRTAVAFEYDTYRWVRGDSLANVTRMRDYLKAIGYRYVC